MKNDADRKERERLEQLDRWAWICVIGSALFVGLALMLAWPKLARPKPNQGEPAVLWERR